MNKSTHARLGQLLVLATLALSATAFAQKTPDTRLNSGPVQAGGADLPRIAASGDAVYVTWRDRRNGGFFGRDIYFNRSLDGGATWLNSDVRLDTTPPGTSDSDRPNIAAAGQSVYVVWIDQRTGNWNIFFNRSLDGGSTWLSSDVRINLGHYASQISDPMGIAAAGDAVYVVWEDNRNGAKDVYFDYSHDRGSTWLDKDIRLDTNPPGSMDSAEPEIAVVGDSVYVAWRELVINRSLVYFNRSLDRGASWMESQVLLDQLGIGSADNHKIAAAEDSVYVAWQDSRDGREDIYLNRSHNRGAKWRFSGTRIDTDTPAGVSRSVLPRVAASGDAVYVSWSEGSGGNHVGFNRSLDRGQTWMANEVALDSKRPGNGLDTKPSNLIASGDLIFAAWSDRRIGRRDIYFNRSLDRGSTWLAEDILLNSERGSSVDIHAPGITASEESAFLTWTLLGQSERNIYFNIPFGAQPFGEGTPGSNDITPKLEGTDSLNIGSTFTLSITNGLGGAFGLLALGGPDSKSSIPMLGGNLLIDPIDRIIPIRLEGSLNTPGAGTLIIDCPIPDDPAILGFNVNLQALIIDPGSVTGVAWTNAVEAWIL